MKNILPFAVLFFIGVTSFAQTHIQSGPVFGTWSLSGSPYYIEGEIAVPAGQSLTIQPGVLVEFQGHYKLTVQGQLLAVGTESDSITFTINDTTGFHNWSSTDGGWHGISFGYSLPGDDTSRIAYCIFEWGKAVGIIPDNSGGAISVANYHNLVISNSLFSSNIAVGDGGGIAISNSDIIISDNTFYMNGAGESGGGIAVYSCDPQITNNFISENVALNSGGGISLYYNANPNIENNIIFHNFSEFGGGLQMQTNCNPIIRNNIIVGDSAYSEGGGVDLEENCNGIFINNTIVYNVAAFGGGVDCEDNSNPIFRNSILWGNFGTVNGNQVHLFSEDSDPDFYYCDVEGDSSDFGVWYGGSTYFTYTGTYENNISSNPDFTFYNQYIYLLDDLSPCIDTGDPDAIYNDIEDINNPGFALWPSKGTLRNDIGVYGGPYTLSYEVTSVIEDGAHTNFTVKNYSLTQNYPNPFNPTTKIKYTILNVETGHPAKAGKVAPSLQTNLMVFDILGNEIAVLVNEPQSPGSYEVEFNGTGLSSGVYLYRLEHGKYSSTKKMLLIK